MVRSLDGVSWVRGKLPPHLAGSADREDTLHAENRFTYAGEGVPEVLGDGHLAGAI